MSLPSTFLAPGFFSTIQFAQGPSTQAAGPRSAIYVVPILSTGTAQVNQPIQINSESDAITAGGAGSMAHRTARMHFKVNKANKLYLLPYPVTSGGDSQSADGYFTYVQTATASGSSTITICGENIVIPVSTNQTPTQIALTAVGAINARTYFPLTASANAGKVLLTAKTAGQSQGDGTTGVIRFRVTVQPATGVIVSATGSALGLGVGAQAGIDGTTTEAANFLTALSSIDSKRFYYVGSTLWDSASLVEFKNDLTAKAAPLNGNRCVGITANTGLAALAQATSTSLNYERLQINCQPNSEHDVAELTAWVLATRQLQESQDPSFNFNGSRDSNLLPVFNAGDFLSLQNMSDMITDGVAPIGSDGNGGFLVKSVSTRSKSPNGTVEDTRAAETSRPSVCDQFVDDAMTIFVNQYTGFKLSADKLLANGQVDNTFRIPSGVLTPSRLRPLFVGLLREYENNGWLRDVDNSVLALSVTLDPNVGGRFDVNAPVSVIEWVNQVDLGVSEVSPN